MSAGASARDASTRDELERLCSLAQGLATRLKTTADALDAGACSLRIVQGQGSSLLDLATTARRYLRARRDRETALGTDLFADPCWDMMLDLFASQVEGRPVSVSSACIASNVPSTTALRWLARLEELGLVVRSDDPHDARRVFLTLSEHANRAVSEWVETTFTEPVVLRPARGETPPVEHHDRTRARL